jgi:hypothetical protein
VQGKVIQLPSQQAVSTAFLSALMAKTVIVGCCFGEKYFDRGKGRFCGGFCDFLVFCRGKNVVSLWWNA